MDRYMKEAIIEAQRGLQEGGIPIGSVLIKDDTIISRGHNRRVQENDPLAHAEMNCLKNAGRIKNYQGTVLYSTLMPCYMCAGTVIQFKIKKVVVGESENFAGAEDLLKQFGVEVINLNLDECKQMMREFILKNPKLWNEDIGE